MKMDNPNYLVLSDALRIQRPFNSQVSNPFTTAQSHTHQIPNINSYSQLTDTLMRNGSKSIFQLSDAKDLQNLSLVSGYSAHHLLGFQPHFLHHPAMVHGTNSGFFSSGGGAFVKPFPSSAFTPTKCLGLGLDQGLLFNGSNNANSANGSNNNNNNVTGSDKFEAFRTSESSSPACTSLSPPKDELNEIHSEDGDRTCSPERQETPGFRRIGPKLKNVQDSTAANFCPICGQHLASSDLENHFSTELSRLAKFNSYSQRHELRRSFSSEMHALQNSLQGRNNRWETFQRIQTNRQSRLRAKLRKRKFDETDFSQIPSTCQACPVCQMRLQRTQEEVVQHIEDCIRKQHHHHQPMQQEEDETVDVESYTDETSNSSMQTTQSTNLSPKMESNINCLKRMSEEPMSNNQHTHHIHHWKSRLILSDHSITRVTPTSSCEKIDVEYETDKHSKGKRSVSINTKPEDETLGDNIDEEESTKRGSPHREDQKSTEEATSSVEIDSVTDPNTNSSLNLSVITPNSESYVSTTDNITTDSTSKAQVLEELKARIRELESPHYKCFI